jgi:glycosyltransferase involved in cell wall biosynthesis
MIGARQGTRRAIHVGVNAHLLSFTGTYRSAGIHAYIESLLRCLPEADPEIGYTVFLGERRYHGTGAINLEFSRVPTHRPPLRILWEQVCQPWAIYKSGVDLTHGTAFVGPLVCTCPLVITVHDLSFLLYPQSFRAANRIYLRIFTKLSVHRARRLIAVSESTKRDLVRHYRISPGKVDVVHNGVDADFRPLPPVQVARFRVEQGLADRFILFVGTLEPRKNVIGLIEAYGRLSAPRPPLMLVGGKGWLYDAVFARADALGLSGDVHFVGYVPAEALPYWYNAATLFAYPSLYEGFGLPPLEAMACGTPVVATAASSLPEVVGDAGLLVEPESVAALTGAMERVLADSDLRAEMRAAGLDRASRFSWQKTALGTVRSYRRAVAAAANQTNAPGGKSSV